MQAEFAASFPELDIQIVGINQFGQESANSLMTAGRTTPWLQDVDSDNDLLSDIWQEQWNVVYRDVIIVDAENTELGAFNLTTYNLADAPTYTALREILIDVALDQPFCQNRANHLDVNGDGIISAQGDVLPGINELNNRFLTDSTGQLPALRLPPYVGEPRIDVSGDGIATAQADILPVINFINNQGSGEGEFSTVVQFGLPDNDGVVTEVVPRAGVPSDASSRLVLGDHVPAAGSEVGQGSGTPVFDWQTENWSAPFIVQTGIQPANRGESESSDAASFPAAENGWLENGSSSLVRAGRQQEADATELLEEIDDLNDLAADVAAVWSAS